MTSNQQIGEEGDSASVSSRVPADSGHFLIGRFQNTLDRIFLSTAFYTLCHVLDSRKGLFMLRPSTVYAMCPETPTLEFGLAIDILALADAKRDKSWQ
jgi:hypothetical protein